MSVTESLYQKSLQFLTHICNKILLRQSLNFKYFGSYFADSRNVVTGNILLKIIFNVYQENAYILTVNNTFCFATIDEVFYYVASVHTTCFDPYIRPPSGEFTKY
jgi:hypothetical protein